MNSHPKCNGSAPEDFRWSPVVEALSGSVVQLRYIARQLPSCQLYKRFRLRQVLTKKPVGVLVRTTLP